MTKEQTILLLDACKEGVMEYQNRKGSYTPAPEGLPLVECAPGTRDPHLLPADVVTKCRQLKKT
jgi:hypothetical protein